MRRRNKSWPGYNADVSLSMSDLGVFLVSQSSIEELSSYLSSSSIVIIDGP